MPDLFQAADPLKFGYAHIYEALTELRESFHRSGRLDDSNAKLDEVTKLFATYLAYRRDQIPRFPEPSSKSLIFELHEAFLATTALPEYLLENGNSIFGSQPTLILRSGDEALAIQLTKLVRNSVDLAFSMREIDRPFDILNEAFGHFVRDNFRSNIEDAQYLTPPEVVDFMVKMVLNDIAKEDLAAHDQTKQWIVLDPTCGVGSFLAAVYEFARKSEWLDPKRLQLFGQDKVERMVRLSAVNLALFDVKEHRISLGNSLDLGSPIVNLNNNVDLIITNPPFGARFDFDYIRKECGDNTPFFTRCGKVNASIDSELLFIDRNLRLLRDGGRLLIVVPDGVISAKGTAALLRQHISHQCTIRAIVALPSVTFAQAGTRTKTAILYVQKKRSHKRGRVFMGLISDLGYEVSSRKGTQIKVPQGTDQLPRVLRAYCNTQSKIESTDVEVLVSDPSCVMVPEADIVKGSWTPNHYCAARFGAVATLRSNSFFDLVPLNQLVEFCGGSRRSENWKLGLAYVSVLHILGEGFLDIGGVMNYSPKTAGTPVKAGDLLLSRINPRIPRVCVLPDLGVRTLCSTEFEVMRPRGSVDVYTLAYLLQSEGVQNQIQSLTSGTSASHNRIRTIELGQVLVPIAKLGTDHARIVADRATIYREVIESLTAGAIRLAAVRREDKQIFGI